MWKVESIFEKITDDFETATVDLDSLYLFFQQTRDSHNKMKIEFESDISYQISQLLDEVYIKNTTEERLECINKINEQIVFDDFKLSDIMKITYDKDDESLYYSFEKQFKNSNFNPKKAKRKMATIYNQGTIFTRAVLSNIIITFEKFLASIYELLVVTEPQKYFEGKTILFSELINKEINEVINNTIQHEVESNMFDSLKTLDRIRDKSNIDVNRYISIRDEFEEIYYRRNAYVHTNGCVNKIYLDKVNPRYTKDVSIGEKLICDDEYLENAILVIHRIITALHFELLKAKNGEIQQYDALMSFGFEMLQNKRYQIAQTVYELLRKERSFEYRDRACIEVNYMLALKLQNENIDELLGKFDISMATRDYVIAKKCLEEKYNEVYELLSDEYSKHFKPSMIQEWPLFLEFRKTELYKQFTNEHAEDFAKEFFEMENITPETSCE